MIKINKLELLNYLKFILAILLSLTVMTILIISGFITLSEAISNFNEAFKLFQSGRNSEIIFQLVLQGGLKSLTFICFLYFGFISYFVFDSVFSYYAFRVISSEYKSDDQKLINIIYKGISWNIYRLFYIMFPPFLVIFATILFILAGILLFNLITFLSGYSIGLTSFLFIFIASLLFLAFIFSIVISLWNFVSTSFGFECAVTEPSLSNSKITERTEKLLITTKTGILFATISIIYMLSVIYQIYIAVNMPDLITHNNEKNLITAIMINVLVLAVIRYISIEAYFNGLFSYFESVTINRDEYYNNLKNSKNKIITPE